MNETPATEVDSGNREKANIKTYFDDLATEYDEKLFSRPPLRDLFEKKKDFLLSTIEGGTVLEVGAGTGQYTELLAEICEEVIVLDVSRPMLSINKQRCSEYDNVRFIQDDITNTGLQTDCFDEVVALAVLYHVPEWRSALSEIARLLKPDGTVVAEFFNTRNPAVTGRRLLWRLQQITDGAAGEFFEAPVFGTTYTGYEAAATDSGFEVSKAIGLGFLDLYRLTSALDFLPANTVIRSKPLRRQALRFMFELTLTGSSRNYSR